MSDKREACGGRNAESSLESCRHRVGKAIRTSKCPTSGPHRRVDALYFEAWA